jgi:hypothetical protein
VSSQYSKAKSTPKAKKQKAKQKVQKPKVKPQKAKSPLPPSGIFHSSKQGGDTGRGVTLQQAHSCFSEHNLVDSAVLPFPVVWLGAKNN